MTTRPKKSAWQLDREIAEALVAAKSREAAPATILRTRLSRGLGSIIRRTQMAMLDAIKKGDNVVTTGGIHGKVTGITDKVATLEVAEVSGQKVRLKVDRDQITRVEKEVQA